MQCIYSSNSLSTYLPTRLPTVPTYVSIYVSQTPGLEPENVRFADGSVSWPIVSGIFADLSLTLW